MIQANLTCFALCSHPLCAKPLRPPHLFFWLSPSSWTSSLLPGFKQGPLCVPCLGRHRLPAVLPTWYPTILGIAVGLPQASRLLLPSVAPHQACAQNVEVSKDCLDMLTKVLVAEPAQRMSMEEIKQHRWFLAGLPVGALDMNEFLLRGMEPQASVCAPAPLDDTL